MSTTRRTKDSVRLGPKAMAELLKAARLEIYECLQVAGPLSIAELAARLGRPADSLYYHVRKLVTIGVIEEVELVVDPSDPDTAARGRPAAVYAVIAKRLDVELDPASSRSRKAWADGGASVLRLAQRNYARALESGDVRPDGARRNLMLRRVKVRLDAAQLRQVNQHLDALDELLCAHAENATGALHAITCLMTPIEEPGTR